LPSGRAAARRGRQGALQQSEEPLALGAGRVQLREQRLDDGGEAITFGANLGEEVAGRLCAPFDRGRSRQGDEFAATGLASGELARAEAPAYGIDADA
jgi:hypothetical protein